MLRLLLAVLLLHVGADRLSAVEPQFPYEAVVEADDVFVRSGPGKRYYATGRLPRGAEVTVHRHDPGGWYMISPPADSFSWIEASRVERHGDHGAVKASEDDPAGAAQVTVRIGSTLSDDHGYSGRRLSPGDEVEILGERTLDTPQGPTRMYQIAPPPREYRWVKGDFILPVDPSLRRERDADPYAVPSDHLAEASEQPETADGADSTPSASSVAATPSPPSLPDAAAGRAPELQMQRDRLQAIDDQYADMMTQDVSQWRIDELEAAYKELESAAAPAIARQIEVRLSALAARRQVYEEYAKFAQLAAQTDERDAALAALQSGGIMPVGAEFQTIDLGAPGPFPTLPATAAEPTTLLAVPPLPTGEAAASETTAVQPQLDGAGLVVPHPRPVRGAPRHLLVSPDGRFLAYLESREVDLDQYLGQSLGLFGKRARDARLQADLIEVRRVTPVQLTR